MSASAKTKLAAALAQHAKLAALIPQLQAEADREFDPADLAEGERVKINYGRAGKVNEMEGKVLGVKIPEGKGSTFIVVQVGEGVDTEVVKVVPSQVLARLDKQVASEGAEDNGPKEYPQN